MFNPFIDLPPPVLKAQFAPSPLSSSPSAPYIYNTAVHSFYRVTAVDFVLSHHAFPFFMKARYFHESK
jgi:hypothetical protein